MGRMVGLGGWMNGGKSHRIFFFSESIGSLFVDYKIHWRIKNPPTRSTKNICFNSSDEKASRRQNLNSWSKFQKELSKGKLRQ